MVGVGFTADLPPRSGHDLRVLSGSRTGRVPRPDPMSPKSQNKSRYPENTN